MYEQFRNETFTSQVLTTFSRLKTYHDDLLRKITAIKAEIKERHLLEEKIYDITRYYNRK